MALRKNIEEEKVNSKNFTINYNKLVEWNNNQKINNIANELYNSSKIIIGAIGETNAIGLDFYYKLTYSGLNASWSRDIIDITNLLVHAKPNTIFFIFSYSGETPEIINWINVIKKVSFNNITIISITSKLDNYVKQNSKYNLKINLDTSVYGMDYYRFFDMKILIFWIMREIFNINEKDYDDNHIKHLSIDKNLAHK